MSLRALESFFNQVEWLPERHDVARWTLRGIRHGFLGIGSERPQSAIALDQIHSATIHAAPASPHPVLPAGDGLISLHSQQIIAVKTADCLPILIHHPKGVLALHAGWKGLATNIVGEALRTVQRLAWDFSELEFALGPCLSLGAFEVGPELLAAFRQEAYQMSDLEFAYASSKGHSDRWHLDLSGLAVLQLYRCGISASKISVIRTCTKSSSQRWHSFRRDGVKAGRNWSWIECGQLAR